MISDPRDAGLFEQKGRILVRRDGVSHRRDEYDEHAFEVLLRMQRDHFWYRGRHRFLLAALRMHLAGLGVPPHVLSVIDLGAGCGGWIDYLVKRSSLRFEEMAAADSSPKALSHSADILGPDVKLFQVDLLNLGWRDRWDLVFLLDVLEHIPDQVPVLEQVTMSLKDDGLLFLTAPALRFFWSHNDEIVRHQRRYALRDLKHLADECNLKLVTARYFMFFLSPLLYFHRISRRRTDGQSSKNPVDSIEESHTVPPAPLNALLGWIFSLETPLGLRMPFPWRTSVLGVFQKGAARSCRPAPPPQAAQGP